MMIVFALVFTLVIPRSALANTAVQTIDFEQFSGPSVFTQALSPLIVGIATFSGGQILNGATILPADRSSVYGTAQFCAGCLPVLTITFAQRVTNFSVFVLNGNPTTITYTVQDDAGNSQTKTLAANIDSGAGTFSLPDSNITSVMVSGSTPPTGFWDFLIDNVTFQPMPGGTPSVPGPPLDFSPDPNADPSAILAAGNVDKEEIAELHTMVGCEADLIGLLPGGELISLGLTAANVQDPTDLIGLFGIKSYDVASDIVDCASAAVITARQSYALYECLQRPDCTALLRQRIGLQ
jgi:hypothetical protein